MALGQVGIGGYTRNPVDAAASRKTAMTPGQQFGAQSPFGQQGSIGSGANNPYGGFSLPSFPGMPGAPGAPGVPSAPSQTAAQLGQQFQIAGSTGSQPGGTAGTGGTVGGTTGGTVPGAPAGTMTNTGEASPDVRYLIDQYKQRLGNDPTQRAIDIATSQTRDLASGMAKEVGTDLARRGIGGSGAAAQYLTNKVYAPAQRQAAGQAAGIALGRQGQLDQLVLGGTGLMKAPQELGLQERQLGLQQMDLQQRADIARAQLGLQAQNQALANQAAQMNMMTSYLNLFR